MNDQTKAAGDAFGTGLPGRLADFPPAGAVSGADMRDRALRMVRGNPVTQATGHTLFMGGGLGQSVGITSAAGQVNTIDGLAHALNEPWMPDNAPRFNLLLSCMMSPDTAYTRADCREAMAFVERHARVYTDPDGNVAVIANPLRSGDPWLPFSVWLNRYWSRLTPEYQQVPGSNSTFSIPAAADGSPSQPTTAFANPNVPATATPETTPTPHGSVPLPPSLTVSGQPAAGMSTGVKIAIGVALVAAAGGAYWYYTQQKSEPSSGAAHRDRQRTRATAAVAARKSR